MRKGSRISGISMMNNIAAPPAMDGATYYSCSSIGTARRRPPGPARCHTDYSRYGIRRVSSEHSHHSWVVLLNVGFQRMCS